MDYDKGVSPVVGVILMVAITAILAAVIGAFVLDLGGGNKSVNAGVTVDNDNTVTLIDKGNADKIMIRDQDGNIIKNLTSVGETFKPSKSVSILAVKNNNKQVIETIQVKNNNIQILDFETTPFNKGETIGADGNDIDIDISLSDKDSSKNMKVIIYGDIYSNKTIYGSSINSDNITTTYTTSCSEYPSSETNKIGYKILIDGNTAFNQDNYHTINADTDSNGFAAPDPCGY